MQDVLRAEHAAEWFVWATVIKGGRLAARRQRESHRLYRFSVTRLLAARARQPKAAVGSDADASKLLGPLSQATGPG